MGLSAAAFDPEDAYGYDAARGPDLSGVIAMDGEAARMTAARAGKTVDLDFFQNPVVKNLRNGIEISRE